MRRAVESWKARLEDEQSRVGKRAASSRELKGEQPRVERRDLKLRLEDEDARRRDLKAEEAGKSGDGHHSPRVDRRL